MMHNSLLIRDKLRARNQDPLVRSRRNPHRDVRLDPTRRAAPNELLLAGSWRIRDEGAQDIAPIVGDLNDFFQRLGVTTDDSASTNGTLILRGDAREMPPGGFRLTVTPTTVQLEASDTAGLWAAVVYLEHEMGVRTGPILPLGTIERTTPWHAQISQAPFGANYLVPDLDRDRLDDDAFRVLMHYGCTGMTIYGDWLCYVQSSRLPELNHPDYASHIAVLRDAVERAGRYGVRLFYVPVSPKLRDTHPVFAAHPNLRGAKVDPGPLRGQRPHDVYSLCSSDPESLRFHAEVMANLFREVPDLGGLILIIGGESYYHCFMRPDRQGLPDGTLTNCPTCAGRRPEIVVNGLLRATAEAVHQVRPTVPVMAWPYSAWWSSDPQQLELLEGLPQDVTWLTTIDKDQVYDKGRYHKRIWDYSVDYTGPADNAVLQRRAASRLGLGFAVKTETALGLECIHIPYMPALFRLAQKWQAVRSLHPDVVVQSWMFFGMWGSRAEELGWWTAWHPEEDAMTVLTRLAARDFGGEASTFYRAWMRLSEAVGHLPYIGPYFRGPEFLGPAHPVVLDPQDPRLEAFQGSLYYLQEHEETFAKTLTVVRHPLYYDALPDQHLASAMRVADGDPWALVADEYGHAVRLAEEAFTAVRNVRSDDPVIQALIDEERLIIELVYRTFRSTLNAVRLLRKARTSAGSPESRAILIDERENTEAARHIFREAPWLDLSYRVDGDFPSSLALITAKLAMIDDALLASRE